MSPMLREHENFSLEFFLDWVPGTLNIRILRASEAYSEVFPSSTVCAVSNRHV